MIRDKHSKGVSGLRTRYFPKSRIGHGLVSMAPWLNVFLLLMFFVLLEGKLAVKPGYDVELPDVESNDGVFAGLVLVVLSVESTERAGSEEIIFFDETRYLVDSPEQMEDLQENFVLKAADHFDAGIIIQADKRVSHKTVMDLFGMARDSGFKNVTIGTRPQQ
jgi:biopolymer transport protein ExbD